MDPQRGSGPSPSAALGDPASRDRGERGFRPDIQGLRALAVAMAWVAFRLVLPATALANTAEQVRASALYFRNWLLAPFLEPRLLHNVPALDGER
jgi:peptidoglycan/LPS O-acetylase OafA/YrhL